ncbi:MAG: Hsp33 family molecular chaperone HslO [Bacteriovoracaceae bacterium]
MKESRLFSFIDNQSAFTLHFLDGAKLMEDIKKIHNIGPVAFKFYRDVVLSSMQMINFMKSTENMGFYIDSEDPYFRFKVEMSEQGNMRTLILPEEFEDFPQSINGKARVTKAFPNKTPYSSVIELKKEPTRGITNKVLKESYQTKTQIVVGDNGDFSLMFSKLPPSSLAKKFDEIVDLPLDNFMDKHKDLPEQIEKEKLEQEKEIIQFFSQEGLTYLGSKEVKFSCPCSKERMVANLLTLGDKDLKSAFQEKESLEVRCDYCNSLYEIRQSEMKAQ